MKAPARPQFGAIPLGPPARYRQAGERRESFAEDDNIPIPSFPRVVKAEGQGAAAAPAATAAASPAQTAAPAFRRFTVENRSYLYEDIKTRISKKDQTKKSVVLNAFHKAGFYVAAEDLVEDGRRAK
jgi:hypothetical protein